MWAKAKRTKREMFKPAESVDTALLVADVSMQEGQICLIAVWVLSVLFRVGFSIFIVGSARRKTCSKAHPAMLCAGATLWAMQRMTELTDTVKTWAYFVRWDRYLVDDYSDSDDAQNMKTPCTADLTGHGDPHRCTITFIVGVKFLVEATVSVAGAWFVMASENNEDVILNCLAAAFISQIDEMMFEHFLSREAQLSVSCLEERELDSVEDAMDTTLGGCDGFDFDVLDSEDEVEGTGEEGRGGGQGRRAVEEGIVHEPDSEHERLPRPKPGRTGPQYSMVAVRAVIFFAMLLLAAFVLNRCKV